MSETSTHHPGRPCRHAIGIMTGTSMDGLDAALITATGAGLEMEISLIGHCSGPIPDEVSEIANLIRLDSEMDHPAMIAPAMWQFGQVHAQAVRELIDNHQPANLAVVAAHGQTVHHEPPVSWQLLNPTPMTTAVDCPIVTDLRQMDLSLGGEGAPITPLTDWMMFRHSSESRMVINLGGFANFSHIPAHSTPEQVRGGDVCICNQLLDTIAHERLQIPYDNAGQWALQGEHQPDKVEELRAVMHAQLQRNTTLNDPLPVADWWVDQTMPGPDSLATAVEAIGHQLGDRVRACQPDLVLAAGGGAHNRALLAAIERHGQVPVQTTEPLGVPIQLREAMAMALLGLLALDGVPITLPSVTGRSIAAPAHIDGSWLLPRSFVQQTTQRM